ncbi:MAG: protein kinase [Polyangiaceae bacterium]|nr:protein kinase [Polyangiaceae bacterium]
MALPNKAKIPVGTILAGKYRITREIGRGGMAAVYEAENVDIGKRVAIKVLAQELTTSAVVVERFLREARAAAAIRSPFICDVYDSGKLEDGRPFLVLELLEGESLYERMTVIRHLDAETTVAVMTQVCRGLTKAHAASIVHRDLKPENIFLTKDEEGRLCAKILDFGLAKFYAPIGGGGDPKQARLTREGAVFGTPAYMSPEQVRGQGAVDHRADLWALGCITYECLTGRTVWQTDQGVAMTFAQIANAALPRPATYRPDLPQAFTAWFDRALDRSIERRFQTAKEFADELSIALGVAEPQSPRGAEPSQVVLPAARSEAEIPVALGSGSTSLDPPTLPDPPRRFSPDAPTARPEASPDAPPMPEIPAAPPIGDARQAGAPDPAQRPSPAGTSKLAFAAPEGAQGAGPDRPPRGASPAGAGQDRKQQGGAGRAIALVVVLVALTGGAYAGYQQLMKPPAPPAGPTVAPVVSSAPHPVDAGSAREAPPPPELPWAPHVSQAQEAIAGGDLKAGLKHLKDAFDKGAHGVPRTFLDHVQVALKDASGKAPCQLTGLSRPRTYDLTTRGARTVPGSRPSLAMGPRGVVITWTDAHEGAEHAYTAALDSAMRTTTPPIDVTPEGQAVGRPELTAVGDKLVLTYWDARGPEAGVHVRWLDADGRIAGPAVSVATIPRGGNFWPALARGPEGFFVAWSDEGDAASEDLFLRRLSPTLEPAGGVVRLTDIAPTGPSKPRARYPSMAVHGDALHIAYRVEREPQHLIQYMRIPLAETGKGLEPASPGARADRAVGAVSLVNTDKTRSDGPALTCGAAACYLVWHGDAPAGGASAAYIDPAQPQPLWRRKFAKLGIHPAVGIAPSGQAQLFWYEGGRLTTAAISRDQVGAPTRFARVTGDQPTPSVAAGSKPGEWYVAWLDYEAGHLEPYAARIQCR